MYDNIIFSAYKNESDTVFGPGYLEEFNGFLTNFGNGFILSNGTFTAQREGKYEFSAAANSATIDPAFLAVEHNGAIVLSFYTYSPDDALSFSWIMELQQGDTVRLKVTSGAFNCGPNYNCIFSGKLINN